MLGAGFGQVFGISFGMPLVQTRESTWSQQQQQQKSKVRVHFEQGKLLDIIEEDTASCGSYFEFSRSRTLRLEVSASKLVGRGIPRNASLCSVKLNMLGRRTPTAPVKDRSDAKMSHASEPSA